MWINYGPHLPRQVAGSRHSLRLTSRRRQAYEASIGAGLANGLIEGALLGCNLGIITRRVALSQ